MTEYRYDAYQRLTGVRYPDGEWVNTSYNGLGLPLALDSEAATNPLNIVNVGYDAAGRLTGMQLNGSSGGTLYRSQSYWPWTGDGGHKPNGNGLLKEIKVGTKLDTAENAKNRLYLLYGYDSFANVSGIKEQYNNSASVTSSFTYDDQNRLTGAYGRSYGWTASGNLSSFEGSSIAHDNMDRLSPAQSASA